MMTAMQDYQALPHSWDNDLRIRDTSAFLASLSGILVWIAEKLDSWPRRKMGADIFRAVAAEFDDQVLGLLRKALAGGTESSVRAVAAVLHEAPRTFIWDQPVFVRDALHVADNLSDAVRHQMMEALWSATIPVAGPVSPVSRSRRRSSSETDRARSQRNLRLDPSRDGFTPIWRAERDIQRELEDDLPTDGRSW